jgi:hypothetical protein
VTSHLDIDAFDPRERIQASNGRRSMPLAAAFVHPADKALLMSYRKITSPLPNASD